MKKFRFLIVCAVIVAITSCSKDNGINFFTVNQDVAFGAQLDSTILGKSRRIPDFKQGPISRSLQLS